MENSNIKANIYNPSILKTSHLTLSDIYPELSEEKKEQYLKLFLTEHEKERKALSKEEIENRFVQIFITKIDRRASSMKTLYYHYYPLAELSKEFDIVVADKNEFGPVDFRLINKELSEEIWVIIVEYLDAIEFNSIAEQLSKIRPQSKLLKVHLVCNKLNRSFALSTDYVPIYKGTVPVEYYINYHDPDLPFNPGDEIVCNSISIKGVNFTTMDMVIEAFKILNGPGQVSIIARNEEGDRQIWQGLFYPSELFS